MKPLMASPVPSGQTLFTCCDVSGAFLMAADNEKGTASAIETSLEKACGRVVLRSEL